MGRSWMTQPSVLVIGAGLAFGVVLWRADLVVDRWRSVCAVTFSPDGRSVAGGSYSGTFFNEDYHWCISDLSQTVALFDADTGSSGGVLDEMHYRGTSWGLPSTPLGQFLSFSTDGGTLAVGTWDGRVKLWNPRTRQLARVLRTESPQVRAVGFSADGRTLAAISRDLLKLWDRVTYHGEERWLRSPGRVRSIAFSPDSELVAIDCDVPFRGAELREVIGWGLKRHLPITDDSVLAMSFAPNGRYVAMGCEKHAVLWDLSEGKVQFEVEAPWTVALAVSPDSKIMTTAGVGGLRFWRTATGEGLGGIPVQGSISSLAYSPDGKLIATGDSLGYLTVWEVGTNRKLWSAHLGGSWKVDSVSVLSGIVGLALLSLVLLGVSRSTKGDHPQRRRLAAKTGDDAVLIPDLPGANGDP